MPNVARIVSCFVYSTFIQNIKTLTQIFLLREDQMVITQKRKKKKIKLFLVQESNPHQICGLLLTVSSSRPNGVQALTQPLTWNFFSHVHFCLVALSTLFQHFDKLVVVISPKLWSLTINNKAAMKLWKLYHCLLIVYWVESKSNTCCCFTLRHPHDHRLGWYWIQFCYRWRWLRLRRSWMGQSWRPHSAL